MFENDYITLNSLEHFLFCPYQWWLIFVEKQWLDNLHTVKGDLLHKRVDNPNFVEKRKNIITCRSMPVYSDVYSLYGICDVMQFHYKIKNKKTPVILNADKILKPANLKNKFPQNVKNKKINCFCITDRGIKSFSNDFEPKYVANKKLNKKYFAHNGNFKFNSNLETIKIIEYKKGMPQKNGEVQVFDGLQLFAQMLCAKEIFGVPVDGYIYYDAIKKRVKINNLEFYKNQLLNTLLTMRQYFKNPLAIPKKNAKKHCKNCSVYEICLPHLKN